jgi:hypothetical protein
MICPPATSEAGARRPAIIQLEQFKEAFYNENQKKVHQEMRIMKKLLFTGELVKFVSFCFVQKTFSL